LPKRSKTDSARSKVETATALGTLGGSIGGPVGAGLGALTGLIIGDRNIVFPLDMVCIPAFQAYMIEGTPALQIYVRAGETVVPTGGNVEDVTQVFEDSYVPPTGPSPMKKKSKATAYQVRYKKHFKQVAPNYKKKDGTWRKDGFRKAVKEAHFKARNKSK